MANGTGFGPVRVVPEYVRFDVASAAFGLFFGIFLRFSRFSPFAEEDFTYLDHSMLSKKKAAFGSFKIWHIEFLYPI